MHSISLEDYEQLSDMDPEDKQTDEAVAEILRQRVNAMVAEVHANYDTKNGYPPTMKGRDKRGRILPLILVKVDRGKFRTLNVQRFGASFLNIVANPNNLVRFHKRRAAPRSGVLATQPSPMLTTFQWILGRGIKLARHTCKSYDKEAEQHDAQLQLLQDTVFNSAVESYVLKQETRAIEEFVKQTLVAAEKECMERIEGENLKRKDIEDVVQAFGEDMNSKEKAKQEAERRKSAGSTSRKHRGGSDGRGDEDDESSQSNVDDSGDEQIFRATMAEAPSTKRRAASKARRKRAPQRTLISRMSPHLKKAVCEALA